jgi:hypothetical protein
MTRLAMALAAWLIAIPNGAAAPVAVSPEGQRAAAPDLAVNGRGEIALLWVDRSPQLTAGAGGDRHVALTDLYVAVSRDGGGSFGEPVRVNRDSGAVWGQAISRPRIVGSLNGSWHVTYTANERDAGSGAARLSTHYARSTDGGRSFGPSRQLSAPATQDLSAIIHGGFASAAAFGTLAAASDGGLHAYWIDTRHMTPAQETAALYGVSSRDDGVTFLAERRILERDVCPCCQLTAVAGAGSGILLGSREVREGNFRPATVARLEPRGDRPFERADVGGAPWQIAGCPMKPTVLAAQGDEVLAAVHSGGEPRPGVILSHSRDGGRSFRSLGLVHPEAAVSDAPAIAISGSVALVAWHAKLDGPRRVFYRLYGPSGEPRSAIREVGGEPGAAQHPVVAARPDGNFQIAWQQGTRIWTDVIPGN